MVYNWIIVNLCSQHWGNLLKQMYLFLRFCSTVLLLRQQQFLQKLSCNFYMLPEVNINRILRVILNFVFEEILVHKLDDYTVKFWLTQITAEHGRTKQHPFMQQLKPCIFQSWTESAESQNPDVLCVSKGPVFQIVFNTPFIIWTIKIIVTEISIA